jgi:hypothetical protein
VEQLHEHHEDINIECSLYNSGSRPLDMHAYKWVSLAVHVVGAAVPAPVEREGVHRGAGSCMIDMHGRIKVYLKRSVHAVI